MNGYFLKNSLIDTGSNAKYQFSQNWLYGSGGFLLFSIWHPTMGEHATINFLSNVT
jgi:hypothetical protein